MVLYKTKTKRVVGTLFLTATHLLFSEAKAGAPETWVRRVLVLPPFPSLPHACGVHNGQVLYMTIHEVKKLPALPTGGGTPLEITCKNFQNISLVVPRESDAQSVYDALTRLALPARLEDLYAFAYRPDFDAAVNGWDLYSPAREYARMGLPNAAWALTPENRDHQARRFSCAVCAFGHCR